MSQYEVRDCCAGHEAGLGHDAGGDRWCIQPQTTLQYPIHPILPHLTLLFVLQEEAVCALKLGDISLAHKLHEVVDLKMIEVRNNECVSAAHKIRLVHFLFFGALGRGHSSF